jgi:Domain of unknown function (DUF1707)/Cell wall-active antibiotics response 4TMS YvqF
VTIEPLRASDRDRDAALETLAGAASDGQLTLEEYAARVDRALQARLQNELAGLTHDLQRNVAAPRSAQSETISAVLGSQTRKGRWVVPAELTLKSVLGDCHIELQDAVLSAPHTTIRANVLLGAITIFVPEGVDVRLSGSATLGSKSTAVRGAPAPNAPVIEIEARVVLGDVTIRPPRRGVRGVLRR